MKDEVRVLSAERWRIAIALSTAVFLLYFGFIFAVAFARETMAREVVPGLSLGILAGAFVIVGAWLTTLIYVRWANDHFDRRRAEIGDSSLISSAGRVPARREANSSLGLDPPKK